MNPSPLTADQRAREHSVLIGIVMDVAMVSAMIAVSLVGGSLTLLAESIRATLGLLPECFTYGLLRRIHRGRLRDLDYGTGKLEQVANVGLGLSMMIAAAWIVAGGVAILKGERALGTPFALACSAVAGIANLCINVVAWDGVRRLPGVRESTLMQAQVTLRWTKLVASLIIGVDLTLAALFTDPVIVAAADATGSFIVAGYMTLTAFQALRRSLPELLDFSAGRSSVMAVERVLARHANDYLRLLRVRTRRASHSIVVELALEFDAALSMAEVGRRTAALKATMREELPDAEVLILASASPSDR